MSYPAARESDFVTQVTLFGSVGTTLAAQVGLSPGQMTAYNGLLLPYLSSWNEYNQTHARPTLQLKRANRAAIAAELRKLVKIVQAFPGTTNELRAELGIPIPDAEPTPSHAPTAGPMLKATPQADWSVLLELRDAATGRRRKPNVTVTGAVVFSFIGDAAPSDPALWKWEGLTTRTKTLVQFPNTVTPGSKVWFTSTWYSRRGLTGPATNPIQSYIAPSGMAQPGAEEAA